MPPIIAAFQNQLANRICDELKLVEYFIFDQSTNNDSIMLIKPIPSRRIYSI